MTIWHFKGVLVSRKENLATSRFFPDHVMAEGVSGLFRLDLSSSLEPEIVEPAHAEERGLISTDAYCVVALAHKIRKLIAETGELPECAYFIA